MTREFDLAHTAVRAKMRQRCGAQMMVIVPPAQLDSPLLETVEIR